MRAPLRRVLWFFLPGWGTEGSPKLDQDWRLRAAFDVPNGVTDVFERLRSRERFLGSDIGGLLPFGVVLSRRDDALFVYASTRSGIDGARLAIERVARAIGLSAELRVGRWDAGLREWRQIDPPLTGQEHELTDAPRARPADRRRKSCPVSSAGSTSPSSRVRFSTSRNGEVSTAPSKKSAVCSAFVSRSRSANPSTSWTSSPTSPASGQVAELVYQPRLVTANPSWLALVPRTPPKTTSL